MTTWKVTRRWQYRREITRRNFYFVTLVLLLGFPFCSLAFVSVLPHKQQSSYCPFHITRLSRVTTFRELLSKEKKSISPKVSDEDSFMAGNFSKNDDTVTQTKNDDTPGLMETEILNISTTDKAEEGQANLVNLLSINPINVSKGTRMGSPLKNQPYQPKLRSFSLDSLTVANWKDRTFPPSYSKNDAYPPSTKLKNLILPLHLQDLPANETLTLADLQSILTLNDYVRQQDLSSPSIYKSSTFSQGGSDFGGPYQTSTFSDFSKETERSTTGVAFPQPSVLSYKALRRGTTIASSCYGMIFGVTVFPNLWLMGLLLGGIYGYDITNYEKLTYSNATEPSNVFSRLCVTSGRTLATQSLQLYDTGQTMWFLYKTGQLSYEYYKQYEKLDQRFEIQDKVDAWNARFQEGKVKFDAWEQEHEIGRKTLATLRTIWLVDEQSKKKQTSNYRIIQYCLIAKQWMRRTLQKIMIFFRNNHSKWWNEFLSGVSIDVQNSGAWGTRIGAVMASLIAINITGALFAISPPLLTGLAILLGIAWPSWVSELLDRIRLLSEETRARGRGDDFQPSNNSINTAKLLGRYDKSKYSYYRRSDGTKKYYRTGQSTFTLHPSPKQKQQKESSLLPWPWGSSESKKKRQPSNPWGLLGGLIKKVQ